MLRLFLAAFATGVASILASQPASAQYIFMDTNKDGIHTAADKIAPQGKTQIDLWLSTDRNRDGTPVDVSCPGGGGWTWKGPQASISGFNVVLHAWNGSLNWISFDNGQPSHWVQQDLKSDSAEFFVSYYSRGTSPAELLSPGKYMLGTLTVSIREGTPSMTFGHGLRVARGWSTCYTTPCLGKTITGGLFLGDLVWKDADSLEYGGVVNRAPRMAEIPALSVFEGDTLTYECTASDEDGPSLSFEILEGPAYASMTTQALGEGKVKGTLRIAPDMCAMGASTLRVGVSDGLLRDEKIVPLNVNETVRPRGVNPFKPVSPERALGWSKPRRQVDLVQDSTWIYGEWEWATETSGKGYALWESRPVDRGLRRLLLMPGNRFEVYVADSGGFQLRQSGRFHRLRTSSWHRFEVDSLRIDDQAWRPGRLWVSSAGPDTVRFYPSRAFHAGSQTFVRVGDLPKDHSIEMPKASEIVLKPPGSGFWVEVPKWAAGPLKRYDPDIKAWGRADFSRTVLDSFAFSMRQAPSAVVGDFDGDFRQDLVFVGSSGRGTRLVGILSDHGRGRVVELALADSLADRAVFSLGHVARGTQLPRCDGKYLAFPTDGIELRVPGGGPPYFYYYSKGIFHEFEPGN